MAMDFKERQKLFIFKIRYQNQLNTGLALFVFWPYSPMMTCNMIIPGSLRN